MKRSSPKFNFKFNAGKLSRVSVRTIGLIVLVLVASVGIIVGLTQIQTTTSPIREVNNSKYRLIFKATDHDVTTRPLKNSLTDNSQQPEYASESSVPVLYPNANGTVDLPRFQGVINFYRTN